MEILNKLREETAVLHQEIEADNIAGKILGHSIDIEEYKLLLFQNYIAYKTSGKEIKKFIPEFGLDKARRLQQDLNKLEVTELNCDLEFSCNSEAEAIGAAYVVEGSAMGGMLIGKEVKNCNSLSSIPDQLFFNGERSGMTGWNEYLKFLRSREFTQDEINTATQKAKETFLLFKAAFNLKLSSC
ncbi:biliverdin-producing heme oxygenase [Gramella sp. MAR_2010_147]|uniref:biliverdin-producing heme oxygenase n=1 Tax=Gramella sp. MAR_2010_147 TaxID=1250205 RepID=UPI00087A5530|nr:biliverdin-producing heme oxygenase [Gramella sp. MAR_2010_147]SDR70764.1 heme oxygenase [Gramella sp. MAR_2010_147]